MRLYHTEMKQFVTWLRNKGHVVDYSSTPCGDVQVIRTTSCGYPCGAYYSRRQSVAGEAKADQRMGSLIAEFKKEVQ